MPNIYGQVVKEDFVAPEGFIRVIAESMVDGELEIVADFANLEWVRNILDMCHIDDEWVLTVCNKNGIIQTEKDLEETPLNSSAPDNLSNQFTVFHHNDEKIFIGYFHKILWVSRLRRGFCSDNISQIVCVDEQGRVW